MLTNDNSNIVTKSWRNFTEYLSSIGNSYNKLKKIQQSIENMELHQSNFFV